MLSCFSIVFQGEADEKKQTVCLNMIVKNESKVITRCLSSVKGLIDYWVIVDTGSTDGTQQIIQEFMQNIPGELYERPWVNFEHNRNEALKLAQGKADYVLLIDADEQLVYDKEFVRPYFTSDCYFAVFDEPENAVKASRILLINMHKDWKWEGVMHEQLVSVDAKTRGVLENLYCQIETSASARSQDPEKYRKDAKILEECLLKEPDNSRYVYYLGQSYLHAGEKELALKNYAKRATMGGWDEEVFWSLLMVGKIQEKLQYPKETIVASYSKAYQYRPTRAEPLFYLANYLIQYEDSILLSYLAAKQAMTLAYPSDNGYIESSIYEYAAQLLCANAAYKIGSYEEAFRLYSEVSCKEKVQENHKILAMDMAKEALRKVDEKKSY